MNGQTDTLYDVLTVGSFNSSRWRAAYLLQKSLRWFFSHGGFFALSSPLVAELFGMKAHSEIFGTGLFIGQIGGAMGPVIAGHIFDVTGGYHIAFMIAAALGVIGLILSVLLKPLVKKE